MKTRSSMIRWFGTTMMVILASAALFGCGSESMTTAVTPALDAGTLVADPLDGALNSTDGVTPAAAGPRIDRLAQVLGLTEDQIQALSVAYAEFRTGIEALRDQVRSGDLTVAEARTEAVALREAFEAELQVILTPEQYDLLQEMRASRDGHGEHGRNRDGRWLAWLTGIGADQDQIGAVMDALAILHDGLADLRTQVKDGTLTREEAIAQVEELRAAFDAALQTILTAEQYEALQELRPDCPGPGVGQGGGGGQGVGGNPGGGQGAGGNPGNGGNGGGNGGR